MIYTEHLKIILKKCPIVTLVPRQLSVWQSTSPEISGHAVRVGNGAPTMDDWILIIANLQMVSRFSKITIINLIWVRLQDIKVKFLVTFDSVSWCMWYNVTILVRVVNTRTEANTCDATSICRISNFYTVCKSMSFKVCVNHNY